MSHHYSGPDYGFPHGDARLDLTDLYAFPKPGDPGKSILIMNVHPSVGVNPAGPTTDDHFATEAIYELKIDTDRDLVADIAYRVRFTSDKKGTQTATLRRVQGEQAAGTGDDGQTIIEGAPVSTADEAHVTAAGDYRFFAGWRSDPFFFDTMRALNNLQFTGDDFFADKDVCSIVLEVPNSALGSGKMGLWHRTVDGTGGKWIQADRGALASQSVFLPGDQKAAYQAGQPAEDARFIPVFAHSLEHTGGYTGEEAKRAAGILLPDILPYDPSKPASYPANGRTLSDDAIDVFLPILTNGKVTRDNVGPHTDLLTSFPYVGSPHKIRSAERVALSMHGAGLRISASPRRFESLHFPRMLLTISVMLASLQLLAQVQKPQVQKLKEEQTMKYPTFYRTVQIDGLSIFYRESGPKDAPTILLLHGLPSSSRMFEPLFTRLSDRYHLVAPDYPGFGHSDWPDPKKFAYTFDHIAEIMNHFTEALGLSHFTLYMQDYGGPVGFRMILAHPDRVEALIVQDAVAHNTGLGENWKTRRAFWADRTANESALRTNLLSLANNEVPLRGERSQRERHNPDLWTSRLRFLVLDLRIGNSTFN